MSLKLGSKERSYLEMVRLASRQLDETRSAATERSYVFILVQVIAILVHGLVEMAIRLELHNHFTTRHIVSIRARFYRSLSHVTRGLTGTQVQSPALSYLRLVHRVLEHRLVRVGIAANPHADELIVFVASLAGGLLVDLRALVRCSDQFALVEDANERAVVVASSAKEET